MGVDAAHRTVLEWRQARRKELWVVLEHEENKTLQWVTVNALLSEVSDSRSIRNKIPCTCFLLKQSSTEDMTESLRTVSPATSSGIDYCITPLLFPHAKSYQSRCRCN